MRTKAPRADRLDKIRDIAIIVHRNNDHMAIKDLERQIRNHMTPPQLNSWSMSNIKEYIAALIFLKLGISLGRATIHLTNLGQLLAAKGNFGVQKLNETEREILIDAIFQNERFQSFLTLFTHGKVPENRTEFVKLGERLKLKHSELKTDLDRREVQDIFKSWALSTEIIEWSSTTNEYFPVMPREIPLEQMLESILEAYNIVEDKTIRRAEIYKIKDIVCQKYRIPCRQFYDYLMQISERHSEKDPVGSDPNNNVAYSKV